MNNVFKIDPEIKQEFLKKKPTGTAKSNFYVLKSADKYEQMIGKKIYDMSNSELKELIVIKFRNTSRGTVSTNVSILRGYIDACIEAKLVVHNENRLATFTRDELKELVSQQALEYKYISPDELKHYQNILENNQDKALLELIHLGVRGRTVKEGTLEEIINLQIDKNSQDFKDNVLKLEKNNGNVRYIKVSESTMELVLETYNDQFYIGNNGVESEIARGGIRKSAINPMGKHVFRTPGKNKFLLFTPVLINSRMQRIQEWCENRFITVNSLYMSGMISMAKDILAEKGNLIPEDYISICEKYNFGETPDKYWLVLKDTVAQYI